MIAAHLSASVENAASADLWLLGVLVMVQE
jgi:hypothetical protein